MKYCQKCGTKMEDIAAFCPECGTRVAELAGITSTEAQYFHGMKAIGGLKIWLWILLGGGCLGVVYDLYLAYQFRWFGASTVFLLLAMTAVMVAEVYGVYRLLNGQKTGLFIILGCLGISIVINTINRNVYGFIESFIIAAISFGILWALGSKQWEYFE